MKTIKHTLASILILCLATFSTLKATPVLTPTITSFSPVSGAAGITVTITGSNFSTTTTNNVVFFGATRATVTLATATQLTVTVPNGATYAPITVLNTTTNLAVYSRAKFTPTFNPAKTSLTVNDFAGKVDFLTGIKYYAITIADLDGDGKPDLVMLNRASNLVSIYRNICTTGSLTTSSFETKVDFATGINPTSLAIGDLDGDGKPDLAIGNSNGDNVSVLRNTSTSGSITSSSFATKVDFASGTNSVALAIGDLDGDGKPDLAVVNYTPNTVSVLRNTSTSGSITTSSFAAKVAFTTGTNPLSIAIGDLDGDGKPDLVTADYGSAKVSVLQNTSTSGNIVASSFAANVDFTAGTSPYLVVLGDLDGDGKTDLAVANSGSASISVLRNICTSGSISTGSFAAKVDFATGVNPQSIATGDIDGDGKPDLIAANLVSATISVIRNTSTSGSIGTGSFAAKVDFVTVNPNFLAVGDLDGDGKPDLVTASVGTARFCLLQNIIPLTITSFSPTSATIGTTVTIHGHNFTGTSQVTFGNFNASSFIVLNDSTIAAVLGVGMQGSANVTVINGNTASLAGFSYCSYTVTVSVFLSSNSTSNSTQMFTATPNYTGGGLVTYNFNKNGITKQSSTSNQWIATSLMNGDVVTCDIIIQGGSCILNATAISNSLSICLGTRPSIGGSYLTTPIICSIGGTAVANNTNTSGGGVWTSSDTTIATATNNAARAAALIKGLNNGKVTLTYTKTGGNGCTASAGISVTVAAVTPPSIVAAPVNICKGIATPLTATPSGGVWVSQNGSASVNTSGVVTANAGGGTAVINYTFTDSITGCSAAATANMTINPLPAAPSIAYAAGTPNPQSGAVPTSAFCKGKTFALIGTPVGGVWSATNPAVVSITGGGVTSTVDTGIGYVAYTVTSAAGCSSSKTYIGKVVKCGPRAISNEQLVSSNEFTMYPNPAHSLINLNVKTLIGSGSIVVTDLYGKQVRTQTSSMGSNTVDISSLSKGFYFVSIITSEGKITKKLVVE